MQEREMLQRHTQVGKFKVTNIPSFSKILYVVRQWNWALVRCFYHPFLECLNLLSYVLFSQQKLNDDIQKLALKVKHHEDNLKFLKTQINGVDESIIDMKG